MEKSEGLSTPLFRMAWWILVLTGLMLQVACGGGAGDSSSVPPNNTGGPTQVLPATFTAQPSDRSVAEGGATSFSVTVANATSLQWQQSADQGATWTDVVAATSSTHTTPATTLAMDGAWYRVVARGAGGDTVNSSAARLTVTSALQAAVVLVSPASLTAVAGAPVQFNVTANGSQLSYVWQSSTDGGATWVDLSAPSLPSLTLPAIGQADDGRHFRVQVGNSLGTVFSSVAVLSVTPAPQVPAFLLEPRDAAVIVGQSATFSVQVAGQPQPNVRWQRSLDGGATWTDVAGATAVTYQLTGVSLTQNGLRLRAVAANSAGSTTSAVVLLSVMQQPQAAVILGAPLDAFVQAGGSALLKATLGGVPTPTVQWQTAAPASDVFVNINGATNGPAGGTSEVSFSTPALTLADNGRRYRVVASNASGQAISSAARVSVGTAPQVQFDGLASAYTVQLVGSSPTLRVSVSGDPAPAIEWWVQPASGRFAPVTGATGLSYTPPAPTSAQAAQYFVRVRNALGQTDSQSITVEWQLPSVPRIDNLSESYPAAVVGTAVTIGTGNSIRGLPAPVLQWRVSRDEGRTWSDVAGANDATLTLPVTSLADNGSWYRLTATNTVGTSTGAVWPLAVATMPVAPQALVPPARNRVATVGQLLTLDGSMRAVGVPTPSLQHQWSRDGGQTWRDFAANDRFGVKATSVAATDDGLLVRVVATNSAGTAISQAVRLRVDTQGQQFSGVWSEWPEDTTVSEGSIAAFTASVSSSQPFNSEWQVSTNGGASWLRLDAAMAQGDQLLTLPLSRSDDGKLFRRVVTATDGAQRVSGAGRVKVLPAPAATLDLMAGNAGGRGMLDGRGTDTRLAAVDSITRDAAGNLYLIDVRKDPDAAYLRQLTPAGDLRTIYLPRLAAQRSDRSDYPRIGEVPVAVAAAPDGTLYIGTRYLHATIRGVFGRVWRRSPAGAIDLYAGGGSGDGNGAAAGFGAISGMVLRDDGSLFVSEGVFTQSSDETPGHCIRKVSPGAVVSTLAGSCDGSHGLRDGTGAQALFSGPRGMVLDATGSLYVAEPLIGTVRRIDAAGNVTTVAGPLWPVPGGLGPAIPTGLALAADGRIAVAKFGVELLDPVARTLESVPGLSDAHSILSDGSGGFWVGTGLSVYWGDPAQVVAPNGYRQAGNAQLLHFSAGTASVRAGRAVVEGSADGMGSAATFQMPRGLQPDGRGGLIVTDPLNFTVRRIDGTGLATTLAGTPGRSGSQDGTGTAARFGDPGQVAVAVDGTVFVADRTNHTVRRIAANGSVTTLAGSALQAGSADGTGASARFNRPSGIALAADGSLLVLDQKGLRWVRQNGEVQTHFIESRWTGTSGVFNRCGDYEGPLAVAADGSIAVGCGSMVLRVSPQGRITNVGAPQRSGYADGAAAEAQFGHITGLSFDNAGRLWVADGLTQSLRRIGVDGQVTTVLGRSDLAYPPHTLSVGWNIMRGGVVLGTTPRLASTMGVAWLGNNRIAVASENGVFVVTVP